MKWHLEEVHFRAELGSLVLDRVYGFANLEDGILTNFGKILTLENIETHLEKIREDQKIWLGMN